MMLYPKKNNKFLKVYNRNSEGFVFTYEKEGSLDDIYNRWAERYFEAGEYISDKLLCCGNQQIIQLDSWFLPLAFLYRHSLELFIKAIMIKYQGDTYTKKEIKSSFHDLKSLVDKLEPVLKKHFDYYREIDWLKNYVESISDFDKASDSFRYPFKIKRNKNEFGGIEYKFEYVFKDRVNIDLVTMVNQFEIAYTILKDIYAGEMKSYSRCDYISYEFMKEGGDYYYMAVIGEDYNMEMLPTYIRGYEEVARRLYDRSECFLLPICYLLRNSIELQLKNMYMRYTIKAKQMSVYQNIYESKHKIYKLWGLNIEILSSTKSASEDNINVVSDYLKSIHDFDSDASHFRYPTDKNLKLYSTSNTYDGQNMIRYLEAVLNAIDGIDYIVDEFYSNTYMPRRMI